MKNSNSQSIINIPSSDVVELPPLLPPQNELILKMHSFLLMTSLQENEKQKQLNDLSNDLRELPSQNDRDFIMKLIELPKESTSLWFFMDKYLVDKAIEVDANNSQQPEKNQITQLRYLKTVMTRSSTQMNNGSALSQEQQNLVKDLLGIKDEKLLDNLFSLLKEAIMSEAMKIHDNNLEKSEEIGELISLRTRMNNGSLLTEDKQKIC
jgi:hypothetical protein